MEHDRWPVIVVAILDAVAQSEGGVFDKDWVSMGMSEQERKQVLALWRAETRTPGRVRLGPHDEI